MLIEDVLARPAKVLSAHQREQYFAEGAVLVEGAVPAHWLKRLRAAAAEFIERSRAYTESDSQYILEDSHTAAQPRLRRISNPMLHHPDYWAFAAQSPAVDAAADVVGPDVAFHHAKLNFKWARGGHKFDWHQDIPAWPHTNYSPVTVGLYLEDCGLEQGPLITVRGSHHGKLHSMYDADRTWVLRIPEDEIDMSRTNTMVGPAGSLVLLNCRTIHGSRPNHSARSRPFLLNVYSAADALPYTANPLASRYAGTIVAGKRARWAHHDPRPCELPPDWSQGYVGPWKHQDEEVAQKAPDAATVT